MVKGCRASVRGLLAAHLREATYRTPSIFTHKPLLLSETVPDIQPAGVDNTHILPFEMKPLFTKPSSSQDTQVARARTGSSLSSSIAAM